MIISSKPLMTNRKKVLILGNGFDLDLGRNTLYKDFYLSEYCPKDYPAPLIKHLNNKWTNNLEAVKWYDLENELFNYYDYLKNNLFSVDVYNKDEKFYIDKLRNTEFLSPLLSYNYKPEYKLIIEGLIEKKLLKAPLSSSYISLSHKDLLLTPNERDIIALQAIKGGLVKYIQEEQNKEINKESLAVLIAKTFIQDNTTLDKSLYSFNYTTIGNLSTKTIVPENVEFDISYVHGNANDNNIILGTRDGEYDNNYDFLQKSFDINYNPPTIVYDLMEADDIIIFGHSLGKNDNQYFKAFFEKQSSPSNPTKKKITIFTKDEKSEIAIKRSLNEMTNYNLTSLYSLNDLRIIKTGDFYNRKITGGDIIQRII